MKFFLISTLCLFFCSLVFTTVASADEVSYTGTWACSQYFNGEMPDISLKGNSLRQIIRISIPGENLRFHFSNIFGDEELELLSVHVAKSAGQGTGSIVPETDTVITFNKGQENVIIPANSDIISDTIPFSASTLEELAITINYGKIPKALTGHAGARTNSFIELGNVVSKETFDGSIKFARWYTLSAIDVVNTGNTEAILCYGDSITDGRGSTTDKQNRWPDIFAEKLQSYPGTQHLAVLNHGIGGSSLYGQTSPQWPTGNGRFQKDVVEQVNVKYMIVLYGINDIIYGNKDADTLIKGFKELIQNTHNLGI
ncbi:hypothetical protein BCR32DRAFT_298796 [Anaeromyces robustus]|uniref:SGNH hydrolase-type esterase domain-containing protein n=1 Tax=Anaeromyces robustus TaxID=1754192 RepID=A0A1Y1XRS6_9FUNG|nr:hypothetical protein BCR32DRAFT_298796 [Anaeromyces robustus]|eukprot:ORX88196.1 hypothetical protein BCR32DRAFT_298796 [Anaeromyces robustus]